jgi:hypothetical protein
VEACCLCERDVSRDRARGLGNEGLDTALGVTKKSPTLWLGTPCLTYQQQWGFTGMSPAVYAQAANSRAVQTHYHVQSGCYERALGAMIRSDVAPVHVSTCDLIIDADGQCSSTSSG